MEKYRDLKMLVFKVYVQFTDFSSFFERIINLYCWEDNTRTWVYLILLVLFTAFIRIVTFRFFILFGIIFRFFKGRNRYTRLYKRNKELVEWTLDNIISKKLPKYHA
jgi:hypothetical protein